MEGNEVGHVGEGGDGCGRPHKLVGDNNLCVGRTIRPTQRTSSIRVRVEFVGAVLLTHIICGCYVVPFSFSHGHFGTTQITEREKKKIEVNVHLFVPLWGYFVVSFVSMVGWTEWPCGVALSAMDDRGAFVKQF